MTVKTRAAIPSQIAWPILVALAIPILIPISPAAAQQMMGPMGPVQSGQTAGSAPWPSNPPPCIAEFLKLREAVEKQGIAAKNARDHNASREEMCKLVTSYVGAEDKMVRYASANASTCGIPIQAVQQMKVGHTRTIAVRTQICSTGPAPTTVAPTLSDALGTNSFASESTKASRMGTFDTLTGNPLKQ